MNFIKRLFLFGIVNILILLTISITMSLLGIKPYLTANGIDFMSLLEFCLLWGMAGSLFSLCTSRIMAKLMMGVKLIDPRTSDTSQARLVDMVHRLATQAGLPKMPEVGYYVSDEVNAFATGPTKSRALVAVSTGLFESMSWDQIEGVLGHEISHVANGDMVTMTLIQGIINAIVMFLSRVLSYFIMNRGRSDNSSPRNSYFLTYIFEIVFSFLGMIVVNWFSRIREFKADEGSARLAGRDKMISALQALKGEIARVDMTEHKSLATLKISGKPSAFKNLFSTHPSLDDRIENLRRKAL